MLLIDILRNSSQNILGVLRGAFSESGCPKRHPDALLAKCMAFNAEATFLRLRDKDAKIFENRPNHVLLVFGE